MSHRAERKDKDCLNCGAEVHGKYCHICGQENVEPKESFWHLVTHFIYDISHFDGKFFSTVKYLLFKPGFLSAEYNQGRRMSYLNPIRMYVFTSAFFFLFFFSMVKPEQKLRVDDKPSSAAGVTKRLQKKKVVLEKALDNLPADSTLAVDDDSARSKLETQLAMVNEDLEKVRRDSTMVDSVKSIKSNDFNFTLWNTGRYKSLAQYDSIQKSLPPAKRHGYISRKLTLKSLELNEKYADNNASLFNDLMNKFLHSFPQILFVSLPLFALLLKLLYFRRKFYYAEHAIYSIHLYCAMFILIFIRIILSFIDQKPYFRWLDFVEAVLLIYIFWYIYKSMRNFYLQGRLKTILKFFLLLVLSSFVMSFLFIIFFFFSVFAI